MLVSISPGILGLMQLEALNSPISADIGGYLHGTTTSTKKVVISDREETTSNLIVISLNSFTSETDFYNHQDGSIISSTLNNSLDNDDIIGFFKCRRNAIVFFST
jgi:hypothetical protein